MTYYLRVLAVCTVDVSAMWLCRYWFRSPYCPFSDTMHMGSSPRLAPSNLATFRSDTRANLFASCWNSILKYTAHRQRKKERQFSQKWYLYSNRFIRIGYFIEGRICYIINRSVYNSANFLVHRIPWAVFNAEKCECLSFFRSSIISCLIFMFVYASSITRRWTGYTIVYRFIDSASSTINIVSRTEFLYPTGRKGQPVLA